MKKIITLALALMTVGTLSAQKDNGGITAEMLQEIRTGQTNSQAEKAARNALALNAIPELATNAENLAMIDTHFSHRVRTKGITDQHQSGRCWLFTGLNVLRAKMINDLDLPSLSSHRTTYLYMTSWRSQTSSFRQLSTPSTSLGMTAR